MSEGTVTQLMRCRRWHSSCHAHTSHVVWLLNLFWLQQKYEDEESGLMMLYMQKICAIFDQSTCLRAAAWGWGGGREQQRGGHKCESHLPINVEHVLFRWTDYEYILNIFFTDSVQIFYWFLTDFLQISYRCPLKNNTCLSCTLIRTFWFLRRQLKKSKCESWFTFR